jgi:hypothetical protein
MQDACIETNCGDEHSFTEISLAPDVPAKAIYCGHYSRLLISPVIALFRAFRIIEMKN